MQWCISSSGVDLYKN